MREKLIDLLKDTRDNAAWHHWGYEESADHLIANGVTVQEWISVKDRFPEKNTSVLAYTDNGIVFQCLYAYDGWDLWEGNGVNITHWKLMPQPPKGE